MAANGAAEHRRVSITDLPVELLSDILRAVFVSCQPFDTPKAWLESTNYLPSPLNRRLFVYRALALVHRAFRDVSKQIFFEDIPCFTVEAIKGLSMVLAKEPASGVWQRFKATEASFEFGFPTGYQGSVTVPRPPKLGQAQGLPQWRPNLKHLKKHYHSFQKDLGALFRLSPALRHVKLSMECYCVDDTRWPASAMSESIVLDALLGCNSLRELDLTDPTPLDVWLPALKHWTSPLSLKLALENGKMHHGLSAIDFCPPASLRRLVFSVSGDGRFAVECPRLNVPATTGLQHLLLIVDANSFHEGHTSQGVADILASCKNSVLSLELRETRLLDGHRHPPGDRPPTLVLFDLLAGRRPVLASSRPEIDTSIVLSSLASLVLDRGCFDPADFPSLLPPARVPKLQSLRICGFTDDGGRSWLGIEEWLPALQCFRGLKKIGLQSWPGDEKEMRAALAEVGIELVRHGGE